MSDNQGMIRPLVRFVLGLCLMGVVGAPAQALNEFQGVVRDSIELLEGPAESYSSTGSRVEPSEEVFILGTSVGGGWARVLRRSGERGWIPVDRLDLYRTTPNEFDDFYEILQRERRETFTFGFDLGTTVGADPLGWGGEAMITLNFTPSGVWGEKSDQFELGLGFAYYFGAPLKPLWVDPDVLENQEKKPFYMFPVIVQWMFRMGSRGTFLFGPRAGFAVVSDPYSRFDFNYPLILGTSMRYYPGQNFGIFVDTEILMRSVSYFLTNFGMTFRF